MAIDVSLCINLQDIDLSAGLCLMSAHPQHQLVYHWKVCVWLKLDRFCSALAYFSKTKAYFIVFDKFWS